MGSAKNANERFLKAEIKCFLQLFRTFGSNEEEEEEEEELILCLSVRE